MLAILVRVLCEPQQAGRTTAVVLIKASLRVERFKTVRTRASEGHPVAEPSSSWLQLGQSKDAVQRGAYGGHANNTKQHNIPVSSWLDWKQAHIVDDNDSELIPRRSCPNPSASRATWRIALLDVSVMDLAH